MKVIKERKEFHVSIKDVVYASSERKFLPSVIPSRIRAASGTEAHKFLQEKRKTTEKSFEHEVMVKIKVPIQGWKFIISGRADSVYEKDGTLILEEIKSVLNLEEFSLESEIAEEYRNQLLLYGHYFLKQNKPIECHLVLIDIFTYNTKVIDVPAKDLTDYIQSQCGLIFSTWNEEQKLMQEQQKRAETVAFPFESYRPSQEEIIQETTECLQNKERLLLLAPSGLGKTVGTLYPSLHYALKNNNRIFVVTSKTTQQHIYQDTLKLFTKQKTEFNSIILTAKEKMCINDVFVCENALCPYLDNYGKAPLDEIVSDMLTKQVLDARYIRKIAKIHTICPFELSLDCSLRCDVIVGDYNYVFHPYIRLRRFFDRPYDNSILIVDEAHNLPSRAMTYYSPEITLQSLSDVIEYTLFRKIPNSVMEIGNDIVLQIMQYIKDSITQFANRDTKKPLLAKFDKEFFQTKVKKYDQFILRYIQAYTSHRGSKPGGRDRIVEFALNLREFTKILKESDAPEYSELLYAKEEKIKIYCKSAALKLEKQLTGFHSVIMQSATLFPIDYFRNMLGLPDSTKQLKFDSPFPQENRLYLLVPSLSTKYENRGESYDQIAAIICKAVNAKKGNYLAFFPSFSYLKAVQREIEISHLTVELMVQDRKMNERKRKNYLKNLQIPNKNYLLLAVHGGIFSEGVDFTGDMAIGAFIIGPGLPNFSTEQELMRKYFELKWEKGFEYAYRNPGMTRVIQAAGRIFRTATDRGFVMLLGHRFSTSYYKNVLPSDWIIEQPQDLIKRIQTFWETQKNDVKEHSLGQQSEDPKFVRKKYPNSGDLFYFMQKR